MSEEKYEEAFVQEAFDTNWVAPVGKNISLFEQEIATYTKMPAACATSSGTAAMHLALELLNIGPGDQVICSTFTFVASCNPIVYVGATPLFIDSEEETWNMDPELLRQALEENPKVKAVIVVHLYGMPAKMAEIMEICAQYNVPVIEDAAESLGSTYRNQLTGSFGAFGIYSFNGNKIITTSGGGMLVATSEQDILHARHLATQAREDRPYYHHEKIGYNYRLSNISAGIGRGQMRVLEQRIDQKRAIHQSYQERIAKKIGRVMSEPDGSRSNYWLSCLLLESKDPLAVMDYLNKENIESRPLWKPMHLQPIFQNEKSYLNGVSERLFATGLCLPSDTKMTQEQQERVIAILNQC